MPAGGRRLRIEQGYLPSCAGTLATDLEGRLRRTTAPDGQVIFHHTIKRGAGLIREEIEREISAEEFARHWPRTEPVRIAKTRHEVRVGEWLWQVDVFDRPAGLVLAEVELSDAQAAVAIPNWIERAVLREVTDDAGFTNRAIALGLAGKVQW